MDRYFSLVCVQKITFRIIKKKKKENKNRKSKKKKKKRDEEMKNRHIPYDIIEFLERKIYI